MNLLYKKFGMLVRKEYSKIRKNILEKKKGKVSMKERLLNKGLITTLLGLGILIFCGILLYQEKQTTEQLTGWFMFAMTLLRAKDSLLFGEPKE